MTRKLLITELLLLIRYYAFHLGLFSDIRIYMLAYVILVLHKHYWDCLPTEIVKCDGTLRIIIIGETHTHFYDCGWRGTRSHLLFRSTPLLHYIHIIWLMIRMRIELELSPSIIRPKSTVVIHNAPNSTANVFAEIRYHNSSQQLLAFRIPIRKKIREASYLWPS